MGLYNDKIDGIYGAETKKGIKKLQYKFRLDVSGVIGNETLDIISRLYDKNFGDPVIEEISYNIEEEVIILIDLTSRSLNLVADNKILKKYPVAIGKWHTPTPVGNWKVTHKASWGEGFGTRWLGLNVPWGIYGIHGTNKPWSIGSNVSGGCIRMHNSNVEEVYKIVKVGTPVIIVCEPFGPFTYGRNKLQSGSRGSDVMEIQKRLEGLGFYNGNIDGVFGRGTEVAVMEFQKTNNLSPTGAVTTEVYDALGILLFE